MQTRSELRKQQAEPAEVTPPVKHHFRFCLVGVIFMTLLMVSLVLNQTFLNKRFVSHEITSSTLETDLLDSVHEGMSQYGIPAKMLTKNEADKIVRTTIDQAFDGQEIKVDLSPVTDQLAGEADSQLAQFGISTSLLPADASDAVTSNVNSAVNSRINTPQVTAAINGLRIAKTVNSVVMVASALVVLLLAVLAVFGRHLITSFSWITSFALVISGGLVVITRSLIPQLVREAPDYSSFAVQCATDFQGTAFTWLALLAVLAVILWLVRLIRPLFSSSH